MTTPGLYVAVAYILFMLSKREKTKKGFVEKGEKNEKEKKSTYRPACLTFGEIPHLSKHLCHVILMFFHVDHVDDFFRPVHAWWPGPVSDRG